MEKIPQVLTIAGSDSGGGAGIQADLKTFQERHVFGTSALTALTAQNTLGVEDIHLVPIPFVLKQLQAITADFTIAATKTGMLSDEAHILCVVAELKKGQLGALVVDPVMIAKGGATLLQQSAIAAVKQHLLPLATVVTPNIPEAEELTGFKIETEADMLQAAKSLQALGAKNSVIKGGHSTDNEEAADLILLEGGSQHWLRSKRIDTPNTHGTGCTFSACITAELAKGKSVLEAITIAKAYIQAAIAYPIAVGHGHGPTNHWAYREVENEK